ncbi:Uncharacterized membrane protein YoaK, UPF0700 family [Chitinophaga sp. CF118]|uniref:YoaK family protein n=1 Tax=Chitinophaga sp. CF118 TaxID=1884367 RepID=UPI0008EC171C|nr:YoaK family protein [Chitinophaga sp. CF118]SFD75111.1 Uncharacterized membrane protein YoaK, UPF0700 family [Chitinophaga sp. CF118]
MEQPKNIWYVTLLLTAVAGYCDTVTFVAADTIFSAHVTGNFIVFAYQMVKGSDIQAWIKLFTFPVFILAVMTGGWISIRSSNQHILLLWQGAILLLAGILACTFGLYSTSLKEWPVYLVAMLVVFAMGIQNAFGKLFSKATYGPTTMMTGNVTQASLDLGTLIRAKLKDAVTFQNLKNQFVTIGGFLAGCLLGALFAQRFGLSVLLLPALAMIVCYFSTHKRAE